MFNYLYENGIVIYTEIINDTYTIIEYNYPNYNFLCLGCLFNFSPLFVNSIHNFVIYLDHLCENMDILN